jgi:hypothetical protein
MAEEKMQQVYDESKIKTLSSLGQIPAHGHFLKRIGNALCPCPRS